MPENLISPKRTHGLVNSPLPNDGEAKSLFAADKRLLFILLCVSTLLLLFVKITFIENETAAFEFLQDRPEGMILQALNGLKLFSIPLVYLWKFTVIAFVIWVGCFMFGYRVTYSQCWGVVIGAEFVFLIPEILKICWFLFVETDPTWFEVRSFYPLALIQLFDPAEVSARWAYPLRALNAFEVVYWFLLVHGIDHYAKKSRKVVWLIVMSSYVLIFLLWLGFYATVYD